MNCNQSKVLYRIYLVFKVEFFNNFCQIDTHACTCPVFVSCFLEKPVRINVEKYLKRPKIVQ